MKALTARSLILLSVFATTFAALADDETDASGEPATSLVDTAIPRSEAPEVAVKTTITLENNEPIQFKTSTGDLDGTEIRRYGGNALRFRYAGNIAIFDALDNRAFQIKNNSGLAVFSVDPDSHALFNNSGNLGVGTFPSSTVKLDVSGSGLRTGIRYLRTDARDARIQVGDPTQEWSMAVGWKYAGDFSIIEEDEAGDRLYIKRGGNVGIGTVNPTEKLDVRGNIKLIGNIVSDGDICIGSGCP